MKWGEGISTQLPFLSFRLRALLGIWLRLPQAACLSREGRGCYLGQGSGRGRGMGARGPEKCQRRRIGGRQAGAVLPVGIAAEAAEAVTRWWGRWLGGKSQPGRCLEEDPSPKALSTSWAPEVWDLLLPAITYTNIDG